MQSKHHGQFMENIYFSIYRIVTPYMYKIPVFPYFKTSVTLYIFYFLFISLFFKTNIISLFKVPYELEHYKNYHLHMETFSGD